jgi:hypothetical protein
MPSVDTSPLHEFELNSSLFATREKLVITPEQIRYNGITIDRNTFEDVKYCVESIVWYKFYVGVEYRIDIKFEKNKILSILFSEYPWKNKHYGRVYREISRHLGNYFLLPRVNVMLDSFDHTGSIGFTGLTISQENVSFESPPHVIDWQNLGLKEYFKYFAIFDKTNPNIHKRVTFNEWNAEILFHTLKTLVTHIQKQATL